ncbi:MAG: alpha/beta hydrolase [Planctomycetes bacterium]|nr:alpha/beta hydrolase [Planctomycetota bacterium]
MNVNHRKGDAIAWASIFIPAISISAIFATTARGAPARRVPDSIEVIRDVVYGKGGGRDLALNIIRPKRPSETPMPVVVWVHGGAWRAGSKEGMQTLPLAEAGYFTASIEYRLSQEATFPAQIEDAKCAIRFLRAKAEEYRIDPDRIGVWGASAGGHLVALLGTAGDAKDLEGAGGWADRSSRVQAVCDFFGPTDFSKMGGWHAAADSPEAQLVGGPVAQKIEAVRRANPITYVTPDDPPFLIVHGDKDSTVPIGQSELLHAALKAKGVDSTLLVVKGGGHGFGPVPPATATQPDRAAIQAQVLAFFDRVLRPKKDAKRAAPAERR